MKVYQHVSTHSRLSATAARIAMTLLLALAAGEARAQTVGIGCPAGSVSPGSQFQSEITINVGSVPLGAYTLAVTYNPSVVEIDSIIGGSASEFSDLPTTNPDSFDSGRTVVSAFNIDSLVSPTGMVGVARLTFDVVGGPGSSTALGIEIITLTRTAGTPINAEASPPCTVQVAGGTTTSTSVTSTTSSTTSTSIPNAIPSITCPTTPQPAGGQFDSQITFNVGVPLGAYTVAVTYGPAVVHIASVAGGTAVEFSQPPTTNPASFASGNTLVSAFNVTSLTSPMGMVNVARVTFDVVGAPSSSTQLGLQVVNLTSTAAQPIPFGPATPCTVQVAGVATTTSTSSSTTSSSTTSTATSTTTSTTAPGQRACTSPAPGPCRVTVDDPAGEFDNVQDAIEEADDGATITVEGTCKGSVRITKREDLVLQGPPPTGGCAEGPGPADLTATIVGKRNGDEAIKVTSSKNVVVQFLNIVEGETSGIEFKNSKDGVVDCSCLARNGHEGVELDQGKRQEVVRNLITQNEQDGIRLKDTEENIVADNVIVDNGDDGIELERDSEENSIVDNVIRDNGENNRGGDGIDVDDSDENDIIDNEVVGNRDSGIELRNADRNVVDGNVIRDNGDGQVDEIECQSGSKKNTGDNVTKRCR